MLDLAREIIGSQPILTAFLAIGLGYLVGQISIGGLHPIPCAAVANDDDECLAMLQRRPGESLHQLLQRLDAAIGSARDSGIHIDEINTPTRPSRRS